MNMLTRQKLTGTMALVAVVWMLASGCAMAGQPNMNSGMKSQSANTTGMQTTNRYGGPAYLGKPALGVTVALVEAGGGPGHFSLVTALNSMLGKKTVNAEVAKLTQQYGKKRVDMWVKVMDFYIADTLKIVKQKGIKLPPPAKLQGHALAKALVKAGTDKQGTFWAGHLFDTAVSHAIHNQLMNDADAKYGAKWDANAHLVTNQAFYDVAQALGDTQVKLASYH